MLEGVDRGFSARTARAPSRTAAPRSQPSLVTATANRCACHHRQPLRLQPPMPGSVTLSNPPVAPVPDMTPDAYAAFTAALLTRLAGEPDIVGLVLLGSSSGHGAPADAHSDHDFFVVTRAGDQPRWRGDPSWLPDAAELVLHYAETAHGVKALYASGHLVEFAVFDLDELAVARVNRYRVVLDRADVAARLAAVRDATAAATGAPLDRTWHVGQLLTALVVGAGRAARGERLSGHQLIRGAAVGHLLALLRAGHAGDPLRDDLDPARRFERAMPEVGGELDAALCLPVIAAARAVLAIAVRELGALVPPAAHRAVADLLARLEP